MLCISSTLNFQNKKIQAGALRYITRVVDSHAFRANVDVRHLLTGVFDELVSSLLAHLSATNYAICPPIAASDEARARQDQLDAQRGYVNIIGGGGDDNSNNNMSGDAFDDVAPPSGPFVDLMRLVAALYPREPALAEKFWNYGASSARGAAHLYHFLRFAADNVNEGIFEPYVVMLAALARGATNAHYAFQFLCSTTNKFVSWQHFFDALHGFLAELVSIDSGNEFDVATPWSSTTPSSSSSSSSSTSHRNVNGVANASTNKAAGDAKQVYCFFFKIVFFLKKTIFVKYLNFLY